VSTPTTPAEQAESTPPDAVPAAPAPRPAYGWAWIARRWLLSRVITALILVPENNILGDVRYYGRQLEGMFSSAGIGGALPEYPVPSMGVFLPPWFAAGANKVAYLVTFVLFMVAIDAVFTAALWRSSGRRPSPGGWLWLLLVPCLGPLTFTRFDLASAALAGGALLLLAARRPVTTGLVTALGAAVKLWPAAMLPALVARRSGRGRLLAAAVLAGAVALGISLAVAGVDRTKSPLTWQGDRGLQIESLFALPLLWGRVFAPGTWDAPYTRFFAFQIEGPGTHVLLRVASVTTVLCLLVLVWLWWRALRREPAAGAVLPVAGLLTIGTAGILILTNKTLSPQYLLWLGGLLAALGCVAPKEPLLARLNPLLIVTCLVTQVIYPIGYALLTGENAGSWFGVLLLTARNAMLVWITFLALRRVVELTRRPAP
jgi:Glycosyltransferase family 87